ncbi:MAG: penicillin-binding transpeptidase domain-containing protein [Porticoccaceae bacterium]|nr:penicillin-binding transpeptidase domain-containing protein [Porticoccaceae bacterium]|tara:strand:+ start:2269 stop:3957 length:1689 start_codon:yes stop_codon:yes gene_type:complete
MLSLVSLPLVLLTKVAQLQIIPNEERGVDFLQAQGDNRSIRQVVVPAYRGLITDRNGEPLAISTPVTAIIANPQQIRDHDLDRLSKAMNTSSVQLRARLKRYRNKSFMYLARQLPTEQAATILDLGIPGVSGRREYKRFYPAGEVTAQLVGFTDINDSGQEGMELAYDTWLTGESGSKKVVKDRAGRVINDISLIKPARSGENLRLSIDLRVQYAAYRALKAAVQKHHAKSGSVVVLDVITGEVLAMVNQPSFNPNDRSHLKSDSTRNRAMTDIMEPGSTVKPFTILAALESGKFSADSVISTSPGYLKVDYKTFVDPSNYGDLKLADVLSRSSQVGTTKVALALDPDSTRELFQRVGFGEAVGSGFPGETTGRLPAYRKWDPVTQATFAFGYGLSVSSLQLARAYAVLANDGVRREVSLVALESEPESVRVIDSEISQQVRHMLRAASGLKGTGKRAMIDGYSVGGKTGTLHKVKPGGGYDQSRYMSAFAGLSPIENPRLVTVVVIDEPRDGDYFGGLVAAPVFSDVTGNALRLLQVTPDQMPTNRSVAVIPATRVKRGDS